VYKQTAISNTDTAMSEADNTVEDKLETVWFHIAYQDTGSNIGPARHVQIRDVSSGITMEVDYDHRDRFKTAVF